MLPANCDAVIRKGSWNVPPIFQVLAKKGGIPDLELYQVFNMGIGMVAIVAPGAADLVLRAIKANQEAWMIGEVTKGIGRTRVV